MDHVVFTEASSREMQKLLDGVKTKILRGAQGRKIPHGKVNPGDRLYLMNNNGDGVARAVAGVKEVLNTEKMVPEQSAALIERFKDELQLSDKQMQRFSGKRYLVLIDVENVRPIEPLEIDKTAYSNMDDWLYDYKL